MKAWIVILRIFGYIWVVMALLVNAAGIFGIWLERGFSGVQEILSPFNVINWIVTIITLAPGLGALILADKLKKKQKYKKLFEKATSFQPSETIITKEDTDHIFSLTRPEWELYVKKITYPYGWKVEFSPQDTGTGVMTYDSGTSFGLSIQPLYSNDDDPPDILIVGSYYPLSMFSDFSDQLKRDLEDEAKKDVGAGYSISATYAKMPHFEKLELMITKAP